MNNENTPGPALAALDSFIADLQYAGASSTSNLQDTRDALAELIAAADAVVNSPVPSKGRLAAALARVQGETATVTAGERLMPGCECGAAARGDFQRCRCD